MSHAKWNALTKRLKAVKKKTLSKNRAKPSRIIMLDQNEEYPKVLLDKEDFTKLDSDVLLTVREPINPVKISNCVKKGILNVKSIIPQGWTNLDDYLETIVYNDDLEDFPCDTHIIK